MARLIKDKNISITQKYNKTHTGIDIVGTTGGNSYVRAHTDGVVYKIVDGRNNDTNTKGADRYGNYIQLKHSGGYYTLYAHLQKGLNLKAGDKVKQGDVIAIMGNSGNSYGTHLHFEVRKPDNYVIDPEKYLESNLPNQPETDATDVKKNKLYYRVHLLKSNKWLSWIEENGKENPGSYDYAGIYGEEIDGIQMKIV